MSASPVQLEDPVAMCRTDDNAYWCHGWVSKSKFRGRLLSADLIGEENAQDIFAGKVKHGWLISVAGDLSGCGWDITMFFLTEPLPEGTTHYGEGYDPETDTEYDGEIVDGPHPVTWWERWA